MDKTTHRMQCIILLLVVAIGGAAAYGAERWETLQAINWVENPHNSTRVGAHGELGPYQFRPATWRMYTKKPFSLAVQRETADDVAVRHYEWIKRGLERNGIEATPYNIALAWNAGLDQVVNGRAPSAAYDYASQVTNLVENLRTRQLVISP